MRRPTHRPFIDLRRESLVPALLFFVLLASLVPQRAVAATGDTDGDGWYTAEKNQRVTLSLVGLTSSVEGDYCVTVEGVRFPYAENDLQDAVHARPDTTCVLNYDVARRAIGAWPPNAKTGHHAWETVVTVARVDEGRARGTGTLAWTNQPAKQHLVVQAGGAQLRLDFRVRVEPFKDPEPDRRDGDADHDGILDFEEAEYARRGVGLGDPLKPDLILVVGYTHDDWRMTRLTKELLRTRFHQRGIRLHLAASEDESLGLCRPGLMKLDGKTLPLGHALNLKEARRMRKAYLDKPMSDHAHLVVLSSLVSPKPGDSWGYAELPGATLVVRSHLPFLGPDFHQYQAKTVLHELGHNLGLCHPSDSGDDCLSGPVPRAERHPGKTVMGTPRSDRGDPVAALRNAWARPLDFSPTQWENARLDWVRRENRPKRER